MAETYALTAIIHETFIFLCYRFLAPSDSMLTISFSYNLGHSTVWSIINEVYNAIVVKMMPKVMPVLQENDWEMIA